MTRIVIQAADLQRGDEILAVGPVEDIYQAARGLVAVEVKGEDGGIISKTFAASSALLINRADES